CLPGYESTGNSSFQPNDGTECIENPQKYCHHSIECITETINQTLENMRNFTEPQDLLKEIVKQTSGELSAVEVITYVEALSRSTSILVSTEKDASMEPSSINFTLTKLVNAANNLVEKDELAAWNRMKEEHRERTITKLLHTVEESALTLAKNYKIPTELQIKAPDMEMKLYTIDAGQTKARVSASMAGDHINLSPKLQAAKDRNGSVSVVFVHYDSVGAILEPSSSQGVAGTGEITVNSRVVAAAVRPADIYQLDHVTFTLRHNQPVDIEGDAIKCAFWEYEPERLQGRWSTRGCRTLHVSSNATTCSCDHLTHFAILMSSGQANLGAHALVLTRITQLGMIISLICLSMCIFTFWFFREIQSTRTTIHKNLCCSLFMAEFIFLVGINMTAHKVSWGCQRASSNPSVYVHAYFPRSKRTAEEKLSLFFPLPLQLFCSVIAGLLHYFFLAVFAWMCIEGIHLYLIVVGVIYNKGFLHRNFYIFGYGSPAVVVTISATLGSKYYGTDKVCWLSTENHFVWSFIGPACLITLVNLLSFGVIIFKVYRHTAVKKPETSHYENIRSCARGAIALFFVLGVTWTFGVLHILHETTLTAYLFTISNTFQGMFLFIFLCVLSRKVTPSLALFRTLFFNVFISTWLLWMSFQIQEEYYRLFKNVPCCFECLR
ncbi:unnamed protein product, partial [Tetraodon nigroviridis]